MFVTDLQTDLLWYTNKTLSVIALQINMRINSTPVAALWACTIFARTAPVAAFHVGRSSSFLATQRAPKVVEASLPSATPTLTSTTSRLQASSKDGSVGSEGWFDGITLNPLYLVPYVSFMAFGVASFVADTSGAGQVILDKFIADPIRPGVNELFVTIFNLLGLM